MMERTLYFRPIDGFLLDGLRYRGESADSIDTKQIRGHVLRRNLSKSLAATEK